MSKSGGVFRFRKPWLIFLMEDQPFWKKCESVFESLELNTELSLCNPLVLLVMAFIGILIVHRWTIIVLL